MHTSRGHSSAAEKRIILKSATWPFVFVAIAWIVKLFEEASGIQLAEYGMAPRNISGIYGIITYPFLHKDFGHLVSNSIPLLFLGTALFYYYRQISLTISWQLFLVSGLWLLLLGQQGSIHIGASGLVYGLAAFHVTAGLIKRNNRLLAFSLLVMFLYGSMVWGLFPDFFPKRNISWEGHLTGMAAGILLAFFHRDKGPQRDRYEWEEEEDEDYEEEGYDDEKNDEDHEGEGTGNPGGPGNTSTDNTWYSTVTGKP